MDDRPLVIAHRGFSALYAENTLPAIRQAIRAGADMVEVDVQETRDGQLVVFHDFQLRRLCDLPGNIRDITLAQVRRRKPDVPTLSETLRAVRGKCPLLVEMKRVDAAKVAQIIERHDMVSDVVVFAFSTELLRTLATACPHITRFGLIGRDLQESIKRLKSAVTVRGLGLRNSLVASSQVVQSIHGEGWKLFVWTVNRAPRMRELAHWGVDGIITNRPDKAVEELRVESRKRSRVQGRESRAGKGRASKKVEGP